MNKKPLPSQATRAIAPEWDPLRRGTGWTDAELAKPQIYIQSTFGDSHPGSVHLDRLVEAARLGVAQAGGKGARYFTTDMCDGESQGTDGINYSLASREMMANLIEIQAGATPFDGGLFIASCDKGLPASLMGLARVNIPSIVVPGGVMAAGPDLLTLEQLGMYSARYERGEIDKETLDWAKGNACPGCGACSFIGTASTMQILAEALGLALPGSALLPADSRDLEQCAQEAGRRIVDMAREQTLCPRTILTKEAFENAILVHAAISGSTNSLLHLPAIAHEAGISIDGDTFDRLHRDARYLLDLRPAGRWPAAFFSGAGGVPAIMEEIKDHLHLDCMTVTGKSVGENLRLLQENGYYERCARRLEAINRQYGLRLKKEDIIRPYEKALGKDGSIAVLKGNLAPEGAVGEHAQVELRLGRGVAPHGVVPDGEVGQLGRVAGFVKEAHAVHGGVVELVAVRVLEGVDAVGYGLQVLGDEDAVVLGARDDGRTVEEERGVVLGRDGRGVGGEEPQEAPRHRVGLVGVGRIARADHRVDLAARGEDVAHGVERVALVVVADGRTEVECVGGIGGQRVA